jgi:hypothetical protein
MKSLIWQHPTVLLLLVYCWPRQCSHRAASSGSTIPACWGWGIHRDSKVIHGLLLLFRNNETGLKTPRSHGQKAEFLFHSLWVCRSCAVNVFWAYPIPGPKFFSYSTYNFPQSHTIYYKSNQRPKPIRSLRTSICKLEKFPVLFPFTAFSTHCSVSQTWGQTWIS